MADHGRFVWYELTTKDIQSGQAFYSAVIGWGTRDASMPGMPYTVFTAGDASVCSMMELPKDARKMGNYGNLNNVFSSFSPNTSGVLFSPSLVLKCL